MSSLPSGIPCHFGSAAPAAFLDLFQACHTDPSFPSPALPAAPSASCAASCCSGSAPSGCGCSSSFGRSSSNCPGLT
eukprot:16446262-Heterocapsa_arctica.AAC.1